MCVLVPYTKHIYTFYSGTTMGCSLFSPNSRSKCETNTHTYTQTPIWTWNVAVHIESVFFLDSFSSAHFFVHLWEWFIFCFFWSLFFGRDSRMIKILKFSLVAAHNSNFILLNDKHSFFFLQIFIPDSIVHSTQCSMLYEKQKWKIKKKECVWPAHQSEHYLAAAITRTPALHIFIHV